IEAVALIQPQQGCGGAQRAHRFQAALQRDHHRFDTRRLAFRWRDGDRVFVVVDIDVLGRVSAAGHAPILPSSCGGPKVYTCRCIVVSCLARTSTSTTNWLLPPCACIDWTPSAAPSISLCAGSWENEYHATRCSRCAEPASTTPMTSSSRSPIKSQDDATRRR